MRKHTSIKQPAAVAVNAARWLLCCLWIMVACCILQPESAFAQPSDYQFGFDPENAQTTGGVTDLEVNAAFQCNADGTTNGQDMFINPQCEATGLLGVFANVVCRLENIFGLMLGLLYCGMQAALLKPLLALLTLYVVVYGVFVILGIVQHSFSEALIRITKIGLVCAIALNSDVAIQVAYKFFIGYLQTSVGIIFSVFDTESVLESPETVKMIQGGYILSPVADDPQNRLYAGEHWMMNFDSTFNQIIGIFVEGGAAFLMIMLILFIFFPYIFFIFMGLILSIIKSFMQAIVGYLKALLGITFLFMLAPIFVSLALFSATKGYFESWLKNLVSFTLQIVIVFMCLMFIIMIDILTFLQQLGDMIRSYAWGPGNFWYFPRNVPTLCRVERNGDGTIQYFKFDLNGNIGNEVTPNINDGFPKCQEEYTFEKIMNGQLFPDNLPPEEAQKLIDAINESREEGEPSGAQAVQAIIDKANDDLKIPIGELMHETDLIGYIITRFFVIILLTFLLERFMRHVPYLADYISGSGFTGRLAGGEERRGRVPGGYKAPVGNTTDMLGLDSAASAFVRASAPNSRNPFKRLATAPQRLVKGTLAAAGAMPRGMVRRSLRFGVGRFAHPALPQDELRRSTEILDDLETGVLRRQPGVRNPW